jgi:tellurite resistance protein
MSTANDATGSSPLRHLGPAWFSIVMGLCGLSLAWHRAAVSLGPVAHAFSLGVGVLAAAVFTVLVLGGALRWLRHADAVREDLRHPVRHAFFAAVPVSLMLLATVGVSLDAPRTLWSALWGMACALQLGVTAWVLGRWLGSRDATPGVLWPGVTPVLFIPVVGNVVAPLAGAPLGHAAWSVAQLGIGVFFWPVVLTLVLVRRLAHSPLPPRLLPSWCILLAPPAVVSLALLQLGAPQPAALGVWGVGAFTLLWLIPLAPRLREVPFGLPWWALSFPLAAFTTLTLRLAQSLPEPGAMALLAWALLALATGVIGGLCAATVRGLWRGELLVPEPAPPAPAAANPVARTAP